jgi:hypothetical protein
MTRKRIPWPAIAESNETEALVFFRSLCTEFGYGWDHVAEKLNTYYHHARTPDACRRKWERMKVNDARN